MISYVIHSLVRSRIDFAGGGHESTTLGVKIQAFHHSFIALHRNASNRTIARKGIGIKYKGVILRLWSSTTTARVVLLAF